MLNPMEMESDFGSHSTRGYFLGRQFARYKYLLVFLAVLLVLSIPTWVLISENHAEIGHLAKTVGEMKVDIEYFKGITINTTMRNFQFNISTESTESLVDTIYSTLDPITAFHLLDPDQKSDEEDENPYDVHNDNFKELFRDKKKLTNSSTLIHKLVGIPYIHLDQSEHEGIDPNFVTKK